MTELPIPPAALRDQQARELVRVWAAGGMQHVTLAAGLWPDPAAWGLMLVDLARHAAASYEESSGWDPGVALKRILEGWEAELNHPTDLPSKA